MGSVDQYYKSRLQVYIACALLLTWNFFGDHSKDFTYFNLPVSRNGVPFLLSILALVSVYFFCFHWKMISETKKLLSVIDYYITLFFSLISLTVSYFYLVEISNSREFLANTLIIEGSVFLSGIEFALVVWFVKKHKMKRLIKKSLIICFLMSFILTIAFSAHLIWKFRNDFKLSAFDSWYFYSFQLLEACLLSWGALPDVKKSDLNTSRPESASANKS